MGMRIDVRMKTVVIVDFSRLQTRAVAYGKTGGMVCFIGGVWEYGAPDGPKPK
jgi:hypothetical protein